MVPRLQGCAGVSSPEPCPPAPNPTASIPARCVCLAIRPPLSGGLPSGRAVPPRGRLLALLDVETSAPIADLPPRSLFHDVSSVSDHRAGVGLPHTVASGATIWAGRPWTPLPGINEPPPACAISSRPFRRPLALIPETAFSFVRVVGCFATPRERCPNSLSEPEKQNPDGLLPRLLGSFTVRG